MADVVLYIREEGKLNEVARFTHDDFLEHGELFDPAKRVFRGYRILPVEGVAALKDVQVLHTGNIKDEESQLGGHNAYIHAAGDTQVFTNTRAGRDGGTLVLTKTYQEFEVVHEHASSARRK